MFQRTALLYIKNTNGGWWEAGETTPWPGRSLYFHISTTLTPTHSHVHGLQAIALQRQVFLRIRH